MLFPQYLNNALDTPSNISTFPASNTKETQEIPPSATHRGALFPKVPEQKGTDHQSLADLPSNTPSYSHVPGRTNLPFLLGLSDRFQHSEVRSVLPATHLYHQAPQVRRNTTTLGPCSPSQCPWLCVSTLSPGERSAICRTRMSIRTIMSVW